MFRWYQHAKVRYGYLRNVSDNIEEHVPEQKVRKPVRSFEDSEWFTRGWTLQELLAPREMCFVDYEWRSIGAKKDRISEIGRTMGIDARYMWGDMFKACIAIKMS